MTQYKTDLRFRVIAKASKIKFSVVNIIYILKMLTKTEKGGNYLPTKKNPSWIQSEQRVLLERTKHAILCHMW